MLAPQNYMAPLIWIYKFKKDLLQITGEVKKVLPQLEYKLKYCSIGASFPIFIKELPSEKSLQGDYPLFSGNVNYYFEGRNRLEAREITFLWILARISQGDPLTSLPRGLSDHFLVSLFVALRHDFELAKRSGVESIITSIKPGTEEERAFLGDLKKIGDSLKLFLDNTEKQIESLKKGQITELLEFHRQAEAERKAIVDILTKYSLTPDYAKKLEQKFIPSRFRKRDFLKMGGAAGIAYLIGKFAKKFISRKMKVEELPYTHPRPANFSLKEIIGLPEFSSLALRHGWSIGPYTEKGSKRELIIIGEIHNERTAYDVHTFVSQLVKLFKVDGVGIEAYYGEPSKDIVDAVEKDIRELIGDTAMDIDFLKSSKNISMEDRGETDQILEFINLAPYKVLLRQNPMDTIQGMAVVPAFGIEERNQYIDFLQHLAYWKGLYLLKQIVFDFGFFLAHIPEKTLIQLDTMLERLRKNNPRLPPICLYEFIRSKPSTIRGVPRGIGFFDSEHAAFHKRIGRKCLAPSIQHKGDTYQAVVKKREQAIKELISKGWDPAAARGATQGIMDEYDERAWDEGIKEHLASVAESFKNLGDEFLRVWGPERNKHVARQIEKIIEKLGCERAVIIIGRGHVDHTLKPQLVKKGEELQDLLPYTSVVVRAGF
ncbi:hypothetical protein HYU14_03025 [Candidatus Woesearchaeota archaeon]|nr:hypothetical protein [Candidatus Woesearchaeota archaeon]